MLLFFLSLLSCWERCCEAWTTLQAWKDAPGSMSMGSVILPHLEKGQKQGFSEIDLWRLQFQSAPTACGGQATMLAMAKFWSAELRSCLKGFTVSRDSVLCLSWSEKGRFMTQILKIARGSICKSYQKKHQKGRQMTICPSGSDPQIRLSTTHVCSQSWRPRPEAEACSSSTPWDAFCCAKRKRFRSPAERIREEAQMSPNQNPLPRTA